jgi:dinuclear metal center YbgI/SA1388 family protein
MRAASRKPAWRFVARRHTVNGRDSICRSLLEASFMTRVADIAAFLEAFAPLALAEAWDNVGLLVGRAEDQVERVMTCLTVTPDSAQEAIDERANLIVSHHPMPFRGLNRITSESSDGRLLLDLIRAGVAVYSPHTAFDSAKHGINERLARRLALMQMTPLVAADDPTVGTGRMGVLANGMSLRELAAKVQQLLAVKHVQVVGALDRPVERVAVGCGSAGELVASAAQAGCDVFVTGEARFHTALEAESLGVCLLLAGHFASERFAVEELAAVLDQQFPAIHVWASRRERDPFDWV